MLLTCKSLRDTALLTTLALATVIWTGCHASGLVAFDIARLKSHDGGVPEAIPPGAAPSDEGRVGTVDARPTNVMVAAGPEHMTLFGDRPDQEAVPYETRLVTNMTRHTTTTEGLDFDPDIHDADNTLVYASTRNSERPDIFLKKVDGATLTQLTGDPADDLQPRFSPDGNQVVFASNRSGNWDIWLINRDGTGLMQLTGDHTDEVAPCWSPDGSQIAYTVWGNRSRQWEIWTLSLAQPGVRHFLAYGMFPDWSPDGGKIAFQRARQRGSHLFSVWTMELVGGEARRPTEVAHRDNAACIAPRWSPDGLMLVYCVVNGDAAPASKHPGAPSAADIWVVEIENGIRMKLTDGAQPAFNPVWAEDGRVFFVSTQTGTENVWSLTAELNGYASGEDAAGRVTRVGQRP
jgi:TolB protein